MPTWSKKEKRAVIGGSVISQDQSSSCVSVTGWGFGEEGGGPKQSQMCGVKEGKKISRMGEKLSKGEYR